MAYLKFYADEEKRWGKLNVFVTQQEAVDTLERLRGRFATPNVRYLFGIRHPSRGMYRWYGHGSAPG